ncbi:Heterokaryon incompatibility protein Het-C [Stigmatella aurantiaca]|uniref:Heterokaryon incompatibility protein Het-C n=1 Tax=Stigmatella aurantiaca TaxID=41 RepID=A0A1H8DMR7_STIAU|nr:Heterokaryon incompatibility protein Het-C [Stigmatella aurantiaca]
MSSRPFLRCGFWLAVALALLVSPSVQAFCPTNGVRCGLGGAGVTHQDLTEETLEDLAQELFALSHPTLAMKQASQEVSKANAEVDDDQTNGFKHFDGESFTAGKQRLVTLFEGVRESLRAEDATAARRQLGQALHTLQDFYSHSNWIESGRSGALPSLWRSGEALPPPAAADAPTCKACEWVLLSDGSLLVDCGDNLLTPLLTTGFYGGENEVPAVPTKCRHGGPFDTGPGPFGGINKDSALQLLSPHFGLHGAAAASALEASKQFIRDLVAPLTEHQRRLLFGVGPALALVLDTSGGWEGGLLSQLVREASRIIDARMGTAQEPSRYILVPFPSTSTGALGAMGDAREFKRALTSLKTGGGGACSGPSMTAVLQALGTAGQGVDLFVFTRSSAGDEALASAVSGLARKRDARIHVFQAGACGGDAVYRRLASETGGQFFQLQALDALGLFHFVDATVRANAVELLSVVEPQGGSRTFAVPVDSSLSQVTFSVSGGTSLRLTQPNGLPLLGVEPGVRKIPLSTGMLVTVVNPQPGTWTASMTPSGGFSFRVSGESALRFERFELVEPFGRPGHQGYAPLVGLPLSAGAFAQARLSGELASTRFELRSQAGGLLQTLALAPEPGGAPLEFFGPVDLPSSPFAIYAVGSTRGGEPYQRALVTARGPQPVRVVGPAAQTLTPGTAASLVFQVHNSGAVNTFRPVLLADPRFPARVTPSSLVLGPEETGTFTVRWETPRNTVPGTATALTLAAESLVPGGPHNFAVVEALVASPPR